MIFHKKPRLFSCLLITSKRSHQLLPGFVVSLFIVKAASGLEAATPSLISGPIPAAILLAMSSADDGLGGIPNGCK